MLSVNSSDKHQLRSERTATFIEGCVDFQESQSKRRKNMTKYFVLLGSLLLVAGSALAQGDFPKVETSPAFMYIHVTPPGQGNGVNCAGAGGTFAYNMTSMLGIAADLGGCKIFGFIPSSSPLSGKIDGKMYTFLFGPRLTFRSKSPFTPFFDVNFGAVRVSLSCSSNTTCSGTSYGKNAFGMTVGGGFDIRLNKKFSLRPIQAEYLYTRFGNSCPYTVCTQNNNQNSFRLKSGIVVAWGGGSK
jgi:opacity protein-like surface antigen